MQATQVQSASPLPRRCLTDPARQLGLLLSLLVATTSPVLAQETVRLSGQIIDAASGQPIAARMYLSDDVGKALLVDSQDPNTPAFHYQVERGASREVHTAVPEAGFVTELPAGNYTVIVERGKEYVPLERQVSLTEEPVQVRLELSRWIDMNARGWYSGDTHIHLPWQQVALPLQAEDLNVGLPITYWATDSEANPRDQNQAAPPVPQAKLIEVAQNRVIWPVNTEYEIFSVSGRRHTLGAFFVINHREPFGEAVPPITPAVEHARREGALLDLDKHNWPWTLMLLPVADIDLFELSNNHLWRTEFLFGDWYPEYAAEYMHVERDANGNLTEQGWIDFGFETYYTLLNCGFRLRPTAGTAVGVHPVPMGFGRVYVHLPGEFDYDAWIQGLDQGHSFVTTGPMLDVRFDGELPGETLQLERPQPVQVRGQAEALHPLAKIEVVHNGDVVASWRPESKPTATGGYLAQWERPVAVSGSGWLVVRCYEDRPDHRPRFAHSGPVHLEIPGHPLRPRRAEVDYLIERMTQEIQRHRGVLSAEALAEFEQALDFYRELRPQVRDPQ